VTNNRYDGLNLQFILGYAFAPLAWVIGISADDVIVAGQLLGEKTVFNEFIAYLSLKNEIASEASKLDKRSIIILTYALCGFSNFASIGIQIGGISSLAPNQRPVLAKLGLRALIGGTLACMLTAALAGIFFV
jgi:CNT family concentrative nucleoside transporter